MTAFKRSLLAFIPLLSVLERPDCAAAQTRPEEPVIVRQNVDQCWRADGLIPVYRQEGAEGESQITGRLQPGNLFLTVRVHAYVWPGIARMLRFKVAVMSAQWTSEPARFAASDTVYVLDYLGDGYYNVWYRGQEYPVEQFWDVRRSPRSAAVLLRRPREQWWALIRSPELQGQEGWVRLDQARRSEADGCSRGDSRSGGQGTPRPNAGADPSTVPPDSAYRHTLRVVTSDLERLVAAEREYFARNGEYTTNMTVLRFAASSGVNLRLRGAGRRLNVSAWKDMVQCHLQLGYGTNMSSSNLDREEGVAGCYDARQNR